MPGNGRARDASGNLVDLISAGMMTVDFFDAAGNKLQVATGKTATIQMDLPQGTASIGGTAMVVGAAIPLWHFDEAQGLWIEEGTGSVVVTATGLAVQATSAISQAGIGISLFLRSMTTWHGTCTRKRRQRLQHP